MKGRRVALLLTGVLPLLAEDDVPILTSHIDENDTVVTTTTNKRGPLHKEQVMASTVPDVQQQHNATSGNDTPVMEENNNATGNLAAMNAAQLLQEEQDPVVSDTLAANTTDDTVDEPPGDTLLDDQVKTKEEEREMATDEIPSLDNGGGESITDEAAVVVDGNAEGTEPASAGDDASAAEDESGNKDSQEADDTATLQQQEEVEEADSTTVNETRDDPIDDETQQQQQQVDDDSEDEPVERMLVDYASKSAGALILEKSASMKGTSNLLNGDKDQYAIAPCQDKRFVVIGLSEDILVKQVKLANYERYSSQVKDFEILGSQTMGNWVNLGTYTAAMENGEEQTFELENPSWARYLKFRFISHYGSEHYCTVSQIKVHGSTMLQGFHEQWSGDEEKDDEEANGDAEDEEARAVVDSITDEQDESSGEADQANSIETASAPQDEAMSTGTAVEESLDDGSSDSVADNVTEQGEESVDEDSSEASPDEAAADKQQDTEKEQNPGTKLLNGIKEKVASLLPHDGPGAVDEEHPVVGDAANDSALESASIVTPAKKTANASHGSTEPLDSGVVATIPDVGGDVVAEPSDVVEVDATEASNTSEENVVDDKGPDERLGSDDSKSDTSEVSTSGDATPTDSTDASVNDSAAATPPHENDSTTTEPTDEARGPSDEGEAEHTEDHATTDDSSQAESKEDSTTQHSEAAAPMSVMKESVVATEQNVAKVPPGIPPGLENIVDRFPSAKCLESLDYADLKARVKAAKAAAQNSQAGPAANMQPIFKTLTDEIKALQTSLSVQKQFSKAMTSCYQSIMLEMAQDLDKLHGEQATRLSKLEADMARMQSWNVTALLSRWLLVLARVLSIGFSVCVTAAIFLHARLQVLYGLLIKQVHVMLESDAVRNLMSRLQAAEQESLILAGFSCIITLLVMLLLMQVSRLRSTKEPVPKEVAPLEAILVTPLPSDTDTTNEEEPEAEADDSVAPTLVLEAPASIAESSAPSPPPPPDSEVYSKQRQAGKKPRPKLVPSE